MGSHLAALLFASILKYQLLRHMERVSFDLGLIKQLRPLW